MCGICGIYDPGGARADDLGRMLGMLVHRGPDGEGVYVDGPVGLGSRRLSIIDLARGAMPMANEDETVWVVHNGEVYNYRALRGELESRGHVFRSHSDTEVIVHLYEELGPRCVERLHGMFAFALWDATRQQLVLARDRIGQKPLFYAQDGETLRFGSELKAVQAVREAAPRMDRQALHHYLSLRFIPAPYTMLHGIRTVPPAHVLVYRAGAVHLTRYWDLSFRDKHAHSGDEWVDALREQLRRAIAAHLESDVPVGAFLSGGMDSSMIVAVMGKDLGLTPDTFAVGVDEQDFDELPYAREVADRYGTHHVEARVTADLIGSLPQMIWHLDEPSDPIAACQYQAAALAARSVKVVLGGDGGDELFGGFDRYLGMRYLDRYTLMPAVLRRMLLAPLLRALPERFTYKSLTQKLRWAEQLAAVPRPGARYAEATCFFRFSHRDKARLFTDAAWRDLRDLDAASVIADAYDQAPADDPLDRMLYADLTTRLPEHSLMLSDRMSMAHGLELRAPFLDHELVAFMAAAPAELKIRGRELKHLLRRLAATHAYLPEAILRRGKQGFMFPVAYWFRGPLHPMLRRVLPESSLVRAGVFRKDEVERLLDEHRRSRVDHHVRLWMLLSLDVWHRMTVERQDPETVREYLVGTVDDGR